MILLWMAEGFLQIDSNEKEAEDTGKGFFEDLYSRSFFQQCSSDSSKFVMHDLINDLAQWAAEDFCFRVENSSEDENQLKTPKNLHHLSFINGGSSYECMKKDEGFDEIKSIRTVLVLMPCNSACDFLNMLPKLRRLRVLSLKGCFITELPNTIGDMKLLRYLDLSYTEMENLPDSINKLCNLETLLLKGCYYLRKLCSDIGNLINLRHLYNSDAWSLDHMPLRIGRLNCLRTLSLYVVWNDVNLGLKELKNLTNLQGKLCISGLEKVNDVEEAKEADCIGKKNLRELELKWTTSLGFSRNYDIETQVLDMLKPYQKLEKLTITRFGGTKFPSWLGNTSFSSLKLLRLADCMNCISLPPLGQLPLLKDLFISGLGGIKSIGLEFYGYGCSMPFQTLENLSIEGMQEWKDWSHLRFGKDTVVYPHLRRLSIENCPNLMGNLPEHLPLLESLCIKRCKQLQTFVPSLLERCNIDIIDCKEVSWSTRDCNFLNSEVLSDLSGRVLLAEMFLQCSSKLVRAVVVDHGKPTCFWQIEAYSMDDISKCLGQEFDQILSLMSDEREELEQGLACRLQYLALRDCNCLMKLTQVLQSLSFLRGLWIQHCPELTSIPDCALPAELKSIHIKKCNALESLPKSWMQRRNTSLEKLRIEGCHSLTYIARVQLPANLKKLKILYCSSLKTLVGQEEVSLTREENVNTGSCSNNFALEYLKMASFHSGGNASLETLCIGNCEKLDPLPNGMNNLTSLRRLSINNCPGIVSFPEDGFPTNITTLSINIDVKICKSLFEWGLHRLTSLKQLYITGGCPDVMFFPQEEIGVMLPTSLTALHISEFPNLERLSSTFQELTSLEELYLCSCPKLEFLPEKGLPPSLLQLEIWYCPLLQQSCENDKGLYWPMIALIPSVTINGLREIPCRRRLLNSV